MPSLKSYIKKTATNAVKKRAMKGVSGAMAGVFGAGLVGKALSAQMDDVGALADDGEAGVNQVASQKSITLQKNMAGTLVRIETIAQHISDNLYNIAGVMNAQLTSMEETRRDMATQSSREAASKEEKLAQGILSGAAGDQTEGGTGSFAKKLLVGQAIKAAVTSPAVLGTLALLASAVGLKLAWNRRDPNQAPSINEQAKENGITPGAQGALNARNALKRDMEQRFGAQEQAVIVGGGRGVVNPEMAANMPEQLPSTGAGAGRGIGGAAPIVQAGGGRGVINPDAAIAVTPDTAMATPTSVAPTFSEIGRGGNRGRGGMDYTTYSAPTPSTSTYGGADSVQTATPVIQPAPAASGPAGSPDLNKTLLNAIAKGESAGAGGYDAMNQGTPGNGPVIGAGNSKDIIGKKLTDMTVGEIASRGAEKSDDAKTRREKGLVFAVGKYQIIPETLKSLIKQKVVDVQEKFTPEVQDRLGMSLIKARGALKLAAQGKFAEAQNALAMEWASIPLATDVIDKQGMVHKAGQSYYQKPGTNVAHKGAGEDIFAELQKSTPSSGSTISTQSVQVASAAKAGGGTTNINTVNNNGGSQQMASARREIPSPIAGRGSLEQSTVFAAAA